MCLCGYHHTDFTYKGPSLSPKITHEVFNAIMLMGHKYCEIRDDGIFRIGIITDTSLTRDEQSEVETLMPPGIIVNFSTREKKTTTIPKALIDWWENSKRYISKPDSSE